MKRIKGFTLIELLVVIAILALIISYALPNYREYVLRSKRVQAQNTLLEIAGLFEKHYANTNAYPTSLTGGGVTGLTLNTGYLNWDEYQISMNNNAGAWTLTATAINAQAQDTTCPQIQFNNLGQKTPIDCWE